MSCINLSNTARPLQRFGHIQLDDRRFTVPGGLTLPSPLYSPLIHFYHQPHPLLPHRAPPLPNKPFTSFFISDILHSSPPGSPRGKTDPDEGPRPGARPIKRPWDDEGSRSSGDVSDNDDTSRMDSEEEVDVDDEPLKSDVCPLDALLKMASKAFEPGNKNNQSEGSRVPHGSEKCASLPGMHRLPANILTDDGLTGCRIDSVEIVILDCMKREGAGTGGKSLTNKKRRKSRTAFTNKQIYELEKRFVYQKYLTPVDRDEIAQSLGLSNAQVITWFQNRRAKLKRDVEELKADMSAAKSISSPGESITTPGTPGFHDHSISINNSRVEEDGNSGKYVRLPTDFKLALQSYSNGYIHMVDRGEGRSDSFNSVSGNEGRTLNDDDECLNLSSCGRRETDDKLVIDERLEIESNDCSRDSNLHERQELEQDSDCKFDNKNE